jgi:hypothetical protein
MPMLRVLKDMRYRTRMLRAGDPVDMKDRDVDFYTRIGHVGPLKVATTPPPVDAPPPVSTTKVTSKRKRAAKKAK